MTHCYCEIPGQPLLLKCPRLLWQHQHHPHQCLRALPHLHLQLLSHLTSHLSSITSHLPHLTCHFSPFTSHLTPITSPSHSHPAPVVSHLSPILTSTFVTFPRLSPLLLFSSPPLLSSEANRLPSAKHAAHQFPIEMYRVVNRSEARYPPVSHRLPRVVPQEGNIIQAVYCSWLTGTRLLAPRSVTAGGCYDPGCLLQSSGCPGRYHPG